MSAPTETTTTSSPQETEAVGARIARLLAPGDVVLLSGEIGSGKSTFVRGACRALGITGPVTSPTFTIGRRYGGGSIPVSHLDLYRLKTLEDEDPALLDDYLRADSVAFIEWSAPAMPRLQSPAVLVELRHAGGERREIEIEFPGRGAAQ